uniref:G-protein coupled receptors family 1 profile domain-containing protein n=1 Tax=Plectus sambesii TaxID=2011161 RepID=A0A914XSQ5_9BILA
MKRNCPDRSFVKRLSLGYEYLCYLKKKKSSAAALGPPSASNAIIIECRSISGYELFVRVCKEMGGACDKAEKQFPVTDVEAAQWRYRSCLVATFVSPAVCCVGFLLNLLSISNMLVYPLLIYILPLVVLIVLNTKIVLTIYEARRLMPTQFDSKRNHKQQREHRSAFMIITIIILFFSCHTGGLAIRFVNFEMHQDSNWFIFTKDVINVLFNVNSSANPLVYFVFTRHFKDLRLSWTAMSWHGHGQGHGHSHTLHRSNRSYTAESLSLRSPLPAARIRKERHAISLNEDNGDEQRMATKALIRRTYSHCRVHLRRMSTASSHTPNPSLMYSSSLLGARRKESSMRGTSPLVHTTSLSPPSTPLKQPCAMGSKRLLQRRSKTSHARLEWSADVIRHADEYC